MRDPSQPQKQILNNHNLPNNFKVFSTNWFCLQMSAVNNIFYEHLSSQKFRISPPPQKKKKKNKKKY